MRLFGSVALLLLAGLIPAQSARAESIPPNTFCYKTQCFPTLAQAEVAMKADSVFGNYLLPATPPLYWDDKGKVTYKYKVENRKPSVVHDPVYGAPDVFQKPGGWGCVNNDPNIPHSGCNSEEAAAAIWWSQAEPFGTCVFTGVPEFRGQYKTVTAYRKVNDVYGELSFNDLNGSGAYHTEEDWLSRQYHDHRRTVRLQNCTDPNVMKYKFAAVDKHVTFNCPAGYKPVTDALVPALTEEGLRTAKVCQPNAAIPTITGTVTNVCSAAGGPHPCHPATGDKSRVEPDFHFAGRPFIRYYHSNPQAGKSEMGRGWTHTYSTRLDPLYQLIAIVSENGTFQFAKPAGVTNRYRLEADANSLIDKVAEGNVAYRWVKGDGQILEFSASGQLLSRRDPNNPAGDVELVYEGTLLKQVVDVTGRALTFEHDEGWISRVWLPDGTSVAYDHDSEFNLTAADYGNGQVKRYHYRDIDNPEQLFDNHLTGITSEDGVRYGTFEYDLYGRVKSSRLHDATGYTESTWLSYDTLTQTTVTTMSGGAMVYTMQPGLYRRVLSVAEYEQVDENTRRLVGTTSNTYTTDGRLSTSTDKKGVVTTYGYQSTYVSSITKATGTPEEQRTEFDRDASNRLVAVRHYGKESGAQVLQRVDGTAYDAGGRRSYVCAIDPKVSGAASYACGSQSIAPAGVRQTRLTYCEQTDVDAGTCPLLGQLIAVDGPRTDVNDVTTYTYYPADEISCATSPTTCAYRKGDLWKASNALGHINEVLAYDGSGRVLSARDVTGVVTDMTYHARGWPTAIKTRGPDSSSEADDRITRIDYYPTGRVQKVTLPDGNFTRFNYDPALRLTDVIDAEGNSLHFTLDDAGNRAKEEVVASNNAVLRTLTRVYDTLGDLRTQKDAYDHATQFVHDAMGETEAVTDPLNRASDMDYDPLGRLTRSIQDVGGLNVTTQFKYDSQDNLTEVVDPKNLSTKYTYNGFGELTRLQSPDTGVTTYTYDSAGNRKTQTDARGVTATYSYDALNRLTSVAYPDSNVSQNYTWDDVVTNCPVSEQFHKGRLSKLKNGPSTTFLRYCYDRFGNVTRKIQTVNGRVFTAIYSYTQSGQLKTLTYPGSGMVVDYVRDTLGRTTEVGVTRAGQARQVLLTAASYYPFGPASEWVFGNGRLFRRTLNDNYQPGVVQDPTADGLTFGYEFDAVGNLVTLRNGDQAEPPKRKFIYDALNRLTEGRNGSTEAVTEAYTYDATGNRLSVTDNGVTSTYTMAGSNHWLYNANGKARGYDAVGNTTSIGGLERQFTYNDANRMNYVRRNGAAAQYYEYNGKGEQIRRWLSGTDNVYTVYDEAGQWLGEYDNAGTPIQQVIWLDNLPVGLVLGANTDPRPLHYIQADALGTPRRIIDPVRNVAVWNWPLTGEAFGNDAPIEDQDGDGVALVFNLRFPGQRFDAATGLNYNYFRDYDSSIGRYAESDPIGLSGGSSTYAYANGNALNRRDVDGRQAVVITPQGPVIIPVIVPGGVDPSANDLSGDVGGSSGPGLNDVANALPGFSALQALSNYLSAQLHGAADTSATGSVSSTAECNDPCKDLNDKVQEAKRVVGSLGGCRPMMTRYELSIRLRAWLALATAREQSDNRCWNGGNTGHQMARAQAWTNVGTCTTYLGGASGL